MKVWLTMYVFLASVLLAGISWFAEAAFDFTKTPGKTVYFLRGSNATLEWEYSVDNRATDLAFVSFNVKMGSQSIVMLYEMEEGKVKVGSNIPPAYVGRVEKHEQATLVLKSISFNDSATYECVLSGKGALGEKRNDVGLIVTGLAKLDPLAHLAKLGGSVTFTCNATAVPSQNFTWRRGEKSEKIVSDARHSITSLTGSSQLTIKNISFDDGGFYVCDGTVNDKQQNTAVGYLEVLGANPFKEDNKSCPTSSYNITVGEQIAICCPVSGYPRPIVTWEKNGNQLQKGENTVLTITVEKDEDFGIYTCTATNFSRTIGPLNISVMRKEQDLPDELSVTVTDSDGDKPASMKWDRPSGANVFVVKTENSRKLAGVDYVCGSQTFLEFHYNSFVFKGGEKKPDELAVCADVTAIGNKGIVAKTATCEKLVIKSKQVTVQPSVVCLLLLLSVNWKLW